MSTFKTDELEYVQGLAFENEQIKKFIKESLVNKQNIDSIILTSMKQIEKINNLINSLGKKENIEEKDIYKLKELKDFYEKFKFKIWNYIAIQKNILKLNDNIFGKIISLKLEKKDNKYSFISERFNGEFNTFINMNNIDEEINPIANELKILYNLIKESDFYYSKNIRDNIHIKYLKQLLEINEINLINYYNNLHYNNLNKKEILKEIKIIQNLIKNFNNKDVNDIYNEINKLIYIKSIYENIKLLIKNFNDIKANIKLDLNELKNKEIELQELEVKYLENKKEQMLNHKHIKQIKIG